MRIGRWRLVRIDELVAMDRQIVNLRRSRDEARDNERLLDKKLLEAATALERAQTAEAGYREALARCRDLEQRLLIRSGKIDAMREELKSLRAAAIGSCEHVGIGDTDAAQD